MKKTNMPALAPKLAVIPAAALLLLGCSKKEDPAPPSARNQKAPESAPTTVHAREAVQDAAQKASAEAGKLQTQAQEQVLQVKEQVVVETDKLRAQAQAQVQQTKDQVAAVADQLAAPAQTQAQAAKDLSATATDKAKTQAQALIDQASKLVADTKYLEAGETLKILANLKLTPEQQKTVDDLNAQVKKGLAGDAAKSVGDLLKGNQ